MSLLVILKERMVICCSIIIFLENIYLLSETKYPYEDIKITKGGTQGQTAGRDAGKTPRVGSALQNGVLARLGKISANFKAFETV